MGDLGDSDKDESNSSSNEDDLFGDDDSDKKRRDKLKFAQAPKTQV